VVIMLRSVEGAEELSAGLYRSSQNAGPHTRAMFEYQDMCVVLRCIPNLLPESPVVAVAVEWSTDYVLLGRDGQRELVSVKHRGRGQGDWTFSRLKTEKVFGDLHAVWRAMGRKGTYFFESNAGFESALRPYVQHRPAEDRQDLDAARRLAKCLGVTLAEAGQFMGHFRLRGEPLPDWAYADDVAAQRLAEVMARLGLDPARASECVAALAEYVAAASTRRRPDPAQRVDRLIGFMQDLATWVPNEPAGAVVTMSEMREVVAAASHAATTTLAPTQQNATQAISGRQRDTQHPEPASGRDVRPEPAYRETLRVIRNRTQTLYDRQREMAELQAFATGDEDHYGNGYLWVCGTPWAGKTALLAEAVQALSAEKNQDVIAYFLIARESQASREQFLSAVTDQLAWLLDTSPPAVADVHTFRDLWARAARRAEKAERADDEEYGEDEKVPRRLLLVVDGLDEDLRPGGHSIAALLPTEHLGQHARVLVSARPHPDIPPDVDPEHPLRTARILNLTESPHATVIRSRAEQEIGAVLSATVDSSAANRDLAFDILGLLTAAVGALSVEDIMVILNASRRDIRAFLANRAARSVELTGAPREERYAFAHQALLDSCIAHPDLGGEHGYMTRIRDWAATWKDRGWPNTYDAASSTPTYLLDSYPAALARSGLPAAPEALAGLVADERWIETALTRVGSQLVLAALHSAIELNPDEASLPALLRVTEHQAQNRARSDRCPGWTGISLAWDALGNGEESARTDAIQSLRRHDPPLLIPVWMNTAAAQSRAAGRAGARGAVRTLATTTRGMLVSGGTIDGTLLLWNPDTPREPAREIGRHDGVVLAAAVTQDGLVASGGLDGTIRLWDPSKADLPAFQLGSCSSRVRVLAITPERMIVSGSHDGEVRLWNPADPGSPGRILGRHDNQVRGIAIAADGVIITGSTDGSVRLWNLRRPESWSLQLGRYGSVMSLALLSGHYIVTAGLNGSVCLWDLRRPAKGFIEMIPGSPARSVTVTPSGHILFGCSDGSLGIWDPAVTGSRGLILGSYPGAVGALSAASGNRIFAANGHVITMFRLTVS
jgi:hypothetical protein